MIKMTISIEKELYSELKQFVPTGKMSEFISGSINNELHNKKAALLQAYQEAYNSSARNQEADEWDVLNADIEENAPRHKKKY